MPRIMHAQPTQTSKGGRKREYAELERKLIEKILTDPEARRIAEGFVRQNIAGEVASV